MIFLPEYRNCWILWSDDLYTGISEDVSRNNRPFGWDDLYTGIPEKLNDFFYRNTGIFISELLNVRVRWSLYQNGILFSSWLVQWWRYKSEIKIYKLNLCHMVKYFLTPISSGPHSCIDISNLDYLILIL